MKLSGQQDARQTKITLSYDQPFLYRKLGDFIYQWLPSSLADIVIICIGSDRSTGDALGPITGTYLSKWGLKNFSVYGTLADPIHALNLNDRLSSIKNKHPKGFVIAIDACLGRSSSIGCINAHIGSLKPGLALKKKLPDVGDFSITGIVNASSPIDFLALQHTRLNLVMQQAEAIARSLLYLHRVRLTEKTSFSS
ncbi:putative sporulation protein YyaC [Amphibacillus marinus]|uniref:Putative sporulation protein YyaC n=1 Tax=Amphibacillus marinus TaxID=872970 RepID=A0A1H8PFT9_9BACI|nr:spore protease YyaC [Amphibacillus marinus]SEO40859.1 putative sporulation protein YyaC [Amphibacillus marinus]